MGEGAASRERVGGSVQGGAQRPPSTPMEAPFKLPGLLSPLSRAHRHRCRRQCRSVAIARTADHRLHTGARGAGDQTERTGCTSRSRRAFQRDLMDSGGFFQDGQDRRVPPVQAGEDVQLARACHLLPGHAAVALSRRCIFPIRRHSAVGGAAQNCTPRRSKRKRPGIHL